jgi:hypothetical protein
MDKKFDFLIIGAQKAGTTSLYNWISQHPGICAPEHLKDYPFFKSDKLYRKGEHFLQKQIGKVSKSKILGSGSVQYIFFKNVPERLFNYNKDIKLILIVRDPIERAVSAYRYAVERGLETRSFKEAVNDEIKYGENAYVDYNDANQKYYLNRGLYYAQLSQYLKYFSQNQILILSFDNLINNKEETLKQVFEFLRVNGDTSEINFTKKNVTKGNARFNKINQMLYSKSFKENMLIRILRKALPQKYKYKLMTGIIQFNRKEINDKHNITIEENTLLRLCDYFKDDVENLQNMLNWKLEHWLEKHN